MGPKNQKKLVQIFRFSSFRLWPFYPTGINIESKRPQLVLKHAEKQSETRRAPAQDFAKKMREGLALAGPSPAV